MAMTAVDFAGPVRAADECQIRGQGGLIGPVYRRHGFLPPRDPLSHFPAGSPLSRLDEIGRDLPSLLQDRNFRRYARSLQIPAWPRSDTVVGHLAQMRLYYVRVGFLASAYINQVGEAPAKVLPHNLAVPLCRICQLLQRPPILGYDGYALYNWKRFRTQGPIALGNIDTLQNFVHLYDEHWFILVHVAIEALAARLLDAVARIRVALLDDESVQDTTPALLDIAASVRGQTRILRRIPEHMDPAIYFRCFRPYIRFFAGVRYEGVARQAMDYRGETGAQSSIMPLVQALMKIPHRPSILIDHLRDMRRYMPARHRALIAAVEAWPDLRGRSDREAYNAVLEAMATFREVHYGWAKEYISRRTTDPRGTGGTPFMTWLQQLIDETRGHMID